MIFTYLVVDIHCNNYCCRKKYNYVVSHPEKVTTMVETTTMFHSKNSFSNAALSYCFNSLSKSTEDIVLPHSAVVPQITLLIIVLVIWSYGFLIWSLKNTSPCSNKNLLIISRCPSLRYQLRVNDEYTPEYVRISVISLL